MATVDAAGVGPRTVAEAQRGVVTVLETAAVTVDLDAVGVGRLTEEDEGGGEAERPTAGQLWPRGR